MNVRHLSRAARTGEARLSRHRRPAWWLIATLVSAASTLVLASPASAASSPPVGYVSGSTGPVACHDVTNNGTTYSYVENDEPTRAYAYAGTSYIVWITVEYEWVNGKWVMTNQHAGAYPGTYTYKSGWYQLGRWTGNVGAGAVELNGAPGRYFSSVETTYWYNSAGKALHSYSNSTNIALC